MVSLVDSLGFLFPYIVLVGGSILAPMWAIWLGLAAGRLQGVVSVQEGLGTTPAVRG